jgi:hypothetical protein
LPRRDDDDVDVGRGAPNATQQRVDVEGLLVVRNDYERAAGTR